MRIRALTALVALAALQSCYSIDVERLPAFDLAQRDATDPSIRPKCVHVSKVSSLGSTIVPFAILNGDFAPAVGSIKSCRLLWQKAATLGADMVIIHDPELYQVGPVGGFSNPMYGSERVGVCYRWPCCRVGCSTNDGVVTAIDNVSLREAGLLVGDRISSINGTPAGRKKWETGQTFLLESRPGDEFKLVWTRPGRGRMEGTAKLLENPPLDPDIRNVIDWK